MTALGWFVLGVLVASALRVCVTGIALMHEHDATEESWKSIMRLEDWDANQ